MLRRYSNENSSQINEAEMKKLETMLNDPNTAYGMTLKSFRLWHPDNVFAKRCRDDEEFHNLQIMFWELSNGCTLAGVGKLAQQNNCTTDEIYDLFKNPGK